MKSPCYAWAEHDMRHYRFVRQLDHMNGAAIEVYAPKEGRTALVIAAVVSVVSLLILVLK